MNEPPATPSGLHVTLGHGLSLRLRISASGGDPGPQIPAAADSCLNATIRAFWGGRPEEVPAHGGPEPADPASEPAWSPHSEPPAFQATVDRDAANDPRAVVITLEGTAMTPMTTTTEGDAPVPLPSSPEPSAPTPADAPAALGTPEVAPGPDTADPAGDLRKLLSVRVNASTADLPGHGAWTFRISKEGLSPGDGETAVAVCVAGEGRFPDGDAGEWSRNRVTAAFRTLACAGAMPAGVSVLRSLSAPESPESSRISGIVRGVTEAARAFGAVVTADVVVSDAPADTLWLVAIGTAEDHQPRIRRGFRDAGDTLVLLGGGVDLTDPAAASLLHTTLVGLIREGVVKSAHACGSGGLAQALFECSVPPATVGPEPTTFLGVDVDLGAEASVPGVRLDALLFGELGNRVLISVAAADAGRVVKQAKIMGVPASILGQVGGDSLSVRAGNTTFSVPIRELYGIWKSAWAAAPAILIGPEPRADTSTVPGQDR